MRIAIVFVVGVLAVTLAGCSSSTSPDHATTAELEISPASGTVLTDFTLDASASEGVSRALQFRWDWENDGDWDTDWSSESTTTRRFASGESVTVAVEVKDGAETDKATAQLALDMRHGHVLAINASPVSATWVLGNDGTHFWASSWNTKRIYKVDPATGDTLESHDPPSGWPTGITWDGTTFWVTDYLLRGTSVCQVDAATWQTLSSFPVQYSALAGGLAWDGEYLYHGSNVYDDVRSNGATGRIHKYTTDGTEMTSFATPAGHNSVCGLAWDGENLWVSAREADTLYVVDPEDGDVLRTVAVPDLARDLTVMDGYVWAICSDFSEEYRKIVP